MARPLIALLCMVTAAAAAPDPVPDHAARMANSLEMFAGDVRGILTENCLQCHGGEKTRSEFDLTTRKGLLAGGDQGIAVVAGKPQDSPLVGYLRHSGELKMPFKKPQLPAESIAAIEKWIELGAAYDTPLAAAGEKAAGPMQVSDEDRAYWAFAPLRTDFGGKQRIDDFIKPENAAPASVLSRRLHFDLTGLPPDPDHAVEDYNKQVESLLASERFGEKWARHWLDVARFAESHGFEHDYDRKHAFHFRDFVIRAFNQDMPYDQFVRWQLAGDELAPDQPLAMMATGFLGAGVFPTQITISEAERVRYDAMDDMLATVGSAMLATTVGCARCHDHKYDPIPTRDYYQMLSAFTTTVRSDVDLDMSKLDPGADVALEEKIKAARAKLTKYEAGELPAAYARWVAARGAPKEEAPAPVWQVLTPTSLQAKGGAVFVAQPDGSHLATGANPAKDLYTFEATAPIGGVTAVRLEALAHESMARSGPGRASNGNIQLTGFELTSAGAAVKLGNPRATHQQNNGSLSIASSLDGNSGTGWALDPQFGKDHAAIFDLAGGAAMAAGAKLVFTLRFDGNTSHNIGRLRLSLSDRPASALDFGGGEDPRLAAEQQIAALLAKGAGEGEILKQFRAIDPSYQGLLAEIGGLEAGRQKRMAKVMICGDGRRVKPMRHHTSSGKIPNFYDQTHLLGRGDPRQKSEVASLGFLQVLSRGSMPEAEGRGGLAAWITDVEKGAGHLLARVIVNRLWQHYFGQGIVATPNDFGLQGERPSKPELLDWLAVELINKGWSLKHIHRLIVTSEAYRSQRAPRRLQAEAIRDNALAVSGLLDTKMYGPGTLDESMKRRSIYFMVKRSKLVPVMQLFDWPDTMSSLGRRAVTTTPSQALVFINDPNMRAMAEGFARRLGAADGHPALNGYRMAYGREPTGPELTAAKNFLLEQLQRNGGDKRKALTDFCGALMSANEFIYVE